MTTSPALLAPDQVNAAIDGRLPAGFARLPDLHGVRRAVRDKSSDAWHVVLNTAAG
jgi:hypothetical protein